MDTGHSPQNYNQQILLSIFAVLGIPGSMLDLGCGDGTMVNMANDLGVRALGVDLKAELPHIQHDLTKPLNMHVSFDMIISIETAEHIEPEAAEIFCQTISKHRTPNTRLVLSAALPGQIGDHHVNCQPQPYWRKLLWDTGGWSYDEKNTAVLVSVLNFTAGPMSHWIPANIQVF